MLIPLIVMGLGLIFINGCTKDDNEIEKGRVSDIDGNVYSTVTIGTQEWMVENLKTTKYNDGNSIPLVTGNADWVALTTPGYCLYDNEITNKTPYGVLYNWYAVNTGKLCPTGWHVPTDAEWTTLTDYAGGKDVAGGKLKSTRTVPDAHPRWESPNSGATDEYGFSALPGGYRDSNGVFRGLGGGGNWWSATEGGAENAWTRSMAYNYRDAGGFYLVYKKDGMSVRCVKN